MDPTLYNAAAEGIIVDADFILADQLQRDEENGYQVTPKGNTVLHVAALYGQSGFVGQVLEITSALLCCKNKKNETALHLAANKGHSEVARVLLRAAGEGNKETLMRMTDDDGDTALHKAVRSGWVDTVRLLVKEDPEFEFPANKAGETPLYLAAESGFVDCLLEILRSSIKPTYGGPCGRTALHAAMIQKHSDCATSLWQWNKSLCEESDQWDWNPLHYAVKRGLKLVVREMLRWKKSLAYIQAGSGNDWTTTIHIAASNDYANMINELLNHCPDCWEMLNSSGQNVLHVAMSNNKIRVINFIRNSKEFHNFIDEADNDGNTPLHLLSASTSLLLSLRGYPHAKMLFNKKDQTPLDRSESGTETTQIEKRSFKRRLRLRLGGRSFEIRGENMQEPEDEMESRGTNTQQRENKAKRDKIGKLQDIMTATQIHLVVAALLVTVTFAAGFTMPGGVESDPGPNKGMAILVRKTAFRAFAVSNAIAFTCSAGAVFSYFSIGDNTAATKKLKIIRPLFMGANNLQRGAILAVVIAFVTGTYATLAHSVGLAATVCLIGCASFVVFTTLNSAFY
ncbi:protein ACCELERATED CELL DEATH 6-like [Lycium ferocissimum]|uniref:protein ACCELERATED CELL DEATH 6-like n=1 Tax=Lycium ferocissimum TaxID=112874 RepID=UPI002815EB4A|nr:protein ACCELERATED CELL DEATH 6-like [Lycium ferocissimum]